MSPTIAECLEHARQCEWYAARTNDEQDRKYLLRKAKHWTKLATKKELEIRASARAAAAEAFPEDHSRSQRKSSPRRSDLQSPITPSRS